MTDDFWNMFLLFIVWVAVTFAVAIPVRCLGKPTCLLLKEQPFVIDAATKTPLAR